MNILVIDDDSSLRRTVRMSLELLGHRATEARDSTQALELLSRRPFDTALLDLRLGEELGLELLPRLLRLAPGLHVVVVTAFATIETAVEAMRRGAFDYLPKPFTPDQLRHVLDRIQHIRRLQTHVDELEEQIRSVVPEVDLQTEEPQNARGAGHRLQDGGHRGHDPHPRRKRHGQRRARPRDPCPQPTCRRRRSSRSTAPAFPPNCWRASLFGHVQGAFTGAVRDTIGKVAAAEGGTLFLDEIGDLPLALQPKLLRLLQERCYERVGETQTRAANVRVLAATNHDLEVANRRRPLPRGPFLPPQRDRSHRAAAPRSARPTSCRWPSTCCAFSPGKTASSIAGFSEAVRQAICSYSWPGNIRELRNAVERAAILASDDLIAPGNLPAQVVRGERVRVRFAGFDDPRSA